MGARKGHAYNSGRELEHAFDDTVVVVVVVTAAASRTRCSHEAIEIKRDKF